MSSASTVLGPLRDGPASSTALVRALQLPPPALSRELHSLQREGRVLKLGATSGTRYALLRNIPGAGTSWPVYQIDPAGRVHELGRLHTLMPKHCYFESKHAALRGLSEGLPWFLRLQQPAGFLGDGLARAWPALELPQQAADWNDEHQLAWCTRHGWDCAGDLVVGAAALEAYRNALSTRQIVKAADRATVYPSLATDVLARGQSVAQLPGESPKFTVLTDHAGHLVQALVKFSSTLDTPEGQRQGDLLLAEHLAHVHLNARGIGAAHSRAFRFDGRIFLEIDRFDRVGTEGRRGLVSLSAALASRGIAPLEPARAAMALATAGALPKTDARQIRLIEAVARLIGCDLRQPGELALFDRHDGSFALAPLFGARPEVFGTQGGRTCLPYCMPEATTETADVWTHAQRIAESYWERLTVEPLLSPDFRDLCGSALRTLRAAAKG